ncbi:MAG: nitroreductase family protein [Endomicrobia bacterium]|nr:nitroreductase family protein [Endomicrobiia bacterium]
MINFIDLIKQRYSCRKFLPIPVEDEKILQCIEAARLAPSACNAQPWKFIVVNNKEVKEKLVNAATSGIYKISKFISTSAVIIVVVADVPNFLSAVGSFLRDTRFYLVDIGIACEHIVLQATELGLGSCYIGWFSEKGVKKVLGIPNKYKVPLLICLGYPEMLAKKDDFVRRRAKSDTRKELKQIVSFNKFEG